MFNENRLKDIELFATRCASDLEYVHDEALKYVMAVGNGRSNDFVQITRSYHRGLFLTIQLDYRYRDSSVILFAARKTFRDPPISEITEWMANCRILCSALFGKWRYAEGITAATFTRGMSGSKNQTLVWMRSKKKTW